jgi:hypothetical protein
MDRFTSKSIRVATACPKQAGILANVLLCSRLEAKGFYEAASTPDLWCQTIQFCLIIDNFGGEYVGLEQFNYLLGVLEKFHSMQYNISSKKNCWH